MRLTRLRQRYAALMGAPFVVLIVVFLFVPFVMAVVFSFTNQRLLSPNPTEFVGLRNYDRVLGLTLYVQQPLRDAGGAIERGATGEPLYGRLRSETRGHPTLHEFRELNCLDRASDRLCLLAKSPLFWKSYGNSLRAALMLVPLQVGLALGLALLVNRASATMSIFRTIYFAPVVTSMVVVAIVWMFLFSADFGMINLWLSRLTFGLFEGVDWLGQSTTALPSIVAMTAWQGAGFQMILFLAGLQSIPTTLYEAAKIDGANAVDRFWHVTLPGLKNTMTFVVITMTLAAMGLFVQIDVMTGGGPADSTTTIVYHIIQEGYRRQDIATGSTLSLIFFVTVLVIALVQRRLFDVGSS
jgi:multiple sugar transport system permease protein